MEYHRRCLEKRPELIFKRLLKELTRFIIQRNLIEAVKKMYNLQQLSQGQTLGNSLKSFLSGFP